MQSICSYKKEVTALRLDEREKARLDRLAKKAAAASLASEDVQTPAETELVCWWCVHSLPKLPCIHLPVKYDEKLDLFTTQGNFCSWQCAKAWALDMNTKRTLQRRFLKQWA